ncbi:MAG: aminotransferase class I/II-fold pyridoxal phosphate-dependent enzyme, partial [Bacteroidia bacterium]|nr:aminotransferase class I/II-fold pyridoxal phosphate-dependent enzyme [Bacteroidia bacterium]
MDISYIINQLGEERADYYNAVAPPLIQTSNFAFNTVEELRKAVSNEKECSIYTRGNNPITDILSKKIAALEKAEDALIFTSGMAAISTAVLANVKAGQHIICVKNPYSWTYKLLNNLLPKYNIETSMIDGTRIENFEDAIRDNTSLIYLESPTSLFFELQDIAAVAKLAKKNELITIIDNSYAGPLYQAPIEMGIDIVVHTASKYFGGHSDLIAGVLCSSKEITDRIFYDEFMIYGGIISPFNAWLMLRSLRTYPLRMERIVDTTQKVVEYLENHSQIERLIYPYSKSHPQYELAKKQMKNAPGLFSVLLKTKSKDDIDKLCN